MPTHRSFFVNNSNFQIEIIRRPNEMAKNIYYDRSGPMNERTHGYECAAKWQKQRDFWLTCLGLQSKTAVSQIAATKIEKMTQRMAATREMAYARKW